MLACARLLFDETKHHIRVSVDSLQVELISQRSDSLTLVVSVCPQVNVNVYEGDEAALARHRCDPDPTGSTAFLQTTLVHVLSRICLVVRFLSYFGAHYSGVYRRDDEPIFTCDAVASLSFGAERRFRVYHPEGGLAFDEVLRHGDLLIFPRMWEHEVLPGVDAGVSQRAGAGKEEDAGKEEVGRVRVNLTFRQVEPGRGG